MQKQQNNLESQKGIVVSYFGNSVAVETADKQVFQCHLRRNQELPVVGDYVSFQQNQHEAGTILKIEPRKSTLVRGDGRGKAKPIAANLDAIIIVMSPPPIFSTYLVDRYLVAAEVLNIPAYIVLNKIDLLDEGTQAEAEQLLASYARIPYPVLRSSIYQPQGLHVLAQNLKDKVSVLVGPSGVGKSSIISKLCMDIEIRTQDVSDKGIGKHTTTATRLYHLSEGGALIDSPGVREFNLWPIDKVSLMKGFREFDAYRGCCKFRDCSHLAEPDCALKNAVLNDEISSTRFESYQTLLKELGTKK